MAVHASHWRYIVAHVLERRVRHAIASQNDMAISRNRCLARVCVCRYSGILFAFASLESFLSPAPTRSLFGMITVPTRLYPWALLIVLQLLPNISLLGHLSGLIVGMLCVPASVSRATYLFVCMCVCVVLHSRLCWWVPRWLRYSAGLLSWAFPSFPGVQELERKPFMARFAALRGFAPCPESSPVSGTAANGDNRPTMYVSREGLAVMLV